VIEFRVLGPLEVAEGDRLLAAGSPQQRALLVVLLLGRGEPVSCDRLIDALWGERPPASATKIVQGYVSCLRRVLGDGMVVTRGRGYQLATEPGQTDTERFESLVAEGRRALEAGDARAAAKRLRQALGLWRGPALTDFAYRAFAEPEIARLEEARLSAVEDRIEAELALSRHVELASELQAMVREHPSRERLVEQLMLALYRSGRQADALEAYRAAHRRLLEDLGLVPDRGLQALERAILAQDPALEPPVRPTRSRQPGRDGSERSRRGSPIAIGGAVLLAVAVSVAVKLTSSSSATSTVAPNSGAVQQPSAQSPGHVVLKADAPL
jgi:DNA-binding SARP family transcriptional activator